MRTRTLLMSVLLGSSLALASAVQAETLRWASQGDALTMDPHAQNEGPTNTMSLHLHDPLVMRANDMSIEPGLATSWEAVEETVWEFEIRDDVTFHDGSDFTAEDVVFSLNRARTEPSDFRNYISSIEDIEVVDDTTIHIHTSGPNPILPQQLTQISMMSKAWAEEHDVETAQDYASGEENYAVRNAMGTGPFKLESREGDVRTVLVRNDDYWGMDRFPMEVERVVYTPISSDSTRVAALLSGELDFVLDPPVQDLERLEEEGDISIEQGEENRTIFLGFNMREEDSEYDDVDGVNPMADKRVREAMYHAVDAETIHRVVMRGRSVPTGTIAPPFINGYPEELDERLPVDQEKARELLAEAGYEDGFELTLHCPNDRYINDEAICQAVAGMLGQVGIEIDLNSQTRSLHFQDIGNREVGFYLLGWGVPTFDSEYVFNYLYHTDDGERGSWNATGFSNDRMDELVQEMGTEVNEERRNEMIAEAWELAQSELVYLPIHLQVLNWATREGVNVPLRADNQPHLATATFDN